MIRVVNIMFEGLLLVKKSLYKFAEFFVVLQGFDLGKPSESDQELV